MVIPLQFDIGDGKDIDEDQAKIRAGVEDCVIGTVNKVNYAKLKGQWTLLFNIKPLIIFNNPHYISNLHCSLPLATNTISYAKKSCHMLLKGAHQFEYHRLIEACGQFKSQNRKSAMDVESVGPASLTGNDIHRIMRHGLLYDTFDKNKATIFDRLIYCNITHLYNVGLAAPLARMVIRTQTGEYPKVDLLERVLLYFLVPNNPKSKELTMFSFPLLYGYANSADVKKYTRMSFSMNEIKSAYRRLVDDGAIIQFSDIRINHSYAVPLQKKQNKLIAE